MNSSDTLDTLIAKALVDHCNEMLLAVDAATLSIVAANVQVCRLLGYEQSSLLGMSIENIETGIAGMFYWQDVASGNIQLLENAESEFQRADGTLMTIEKNISRCQAEGLQYVLIAASDITRRLHDEDALANMSARLKSTLESTADGILAVSGLGHIEGMNHRFSQMWEIPPELLLSSNDQAVLEHLFLSVQDADSLRAFFADTDEGEHAVTLTLANGKIFELKSCPQQATMGRVFSCNDVTARVTAEREAIAAKAEADRANQAKGMFLANMSHEIRTPMNAIIGLSQLALNKNVPDEVRDYLEKIYVSSESLLGILNDILDFSKIESGMLGIEVAEFNLATLLDNLYNMFSARAEQKGLELVLDVPPEMPVLLLGDVLRIQQILANLVGNAIKFTTQGCVRVRLQLLDSTAEQAYIRFSVKDSGIGMSPADQAKLFQPFSQADASITRRFGGTGLGLAISHKLVSLMGSEFAVESAPGQGTTFSFGLRLGVASPATWRDAEHQQSRRQAGALGDDLKERGKALQGARILVAEDNRINQQVVREFLQLSGISVTLANHGKEALQLLEEGDFDAVLMDIHMPEMGGVEATSIIRSQSRYANLPVIALSAGVTQQERDSCMACGMNDFASKPINPQELLNVLSRWVSIEPRSAASGEVVVQPVSSSPSDAKIELPGFDLSEIRSMLDGDEDVLQELLQTFRDSLDTTVAAIDEALQRDDYTAAHHHSHTIKGTAGSMGAAALYKQAMMLDDLLRQAKYDPEVHDAFRNEAEKTREVLKQLD